MEYTVYENLHEKSGTVSNLHGFLNRFLDTGFKTKWTGYWAPPYKFLDYYALRVNGIWLDGESIRCTEYGNSFTFHHETDSLSIQEKVETPEALPGFRLSVRISNDTDEQKTAQVALEPGIDIRHKNNDLGPENYSLETGSGRLTVSNSGRKLMISSENRFDTRGDPHVKEHYPGEKQRCLVPGELVFGKELDPGESQLIQLEFSTSGGSFGSIDSREQEFEHELGRTFDCCTASMENLIYGRNGKGVIAGHPWFQEYWARDSYWTLLGLIDAGHFELAESVLENFVEKQSIGSVINLDGTQEENFPRFDGEPLFVIASDKLERHWKISEKIREAQESVMEQLEIEEGIVRHDPKASWMDTLERSGAVDIQSLWLEAARVTGDKREEELEKGLERFQQEDYMLDHIGDDAPDSINPAVPLMLGHIGEDRAEKYLEKINAEFSSRYGARTRSMADPGYSSDGYHTGSAWGLTTGWAAAANLEYENFRQGINFLEKLTQFPDRNQLGALPETVDAESGELIGAPEQAWSSGIFVHAVDSYLLGIEPRGEKILVDPPGPVSCRRLGKRIGDERLDLEFRDGEVEVLNDPEIRIEH